MPRPANSPVSFGGRKVVAFESRRAPEMADIIRSLGGDPLVAPSMRELPLEDNTEVLTFAEKLFAGETDALICFTGVGTRFMVAAMETRHDRQRIVEALRGVTLVARGPKPVKALRGLGLEPDITVGEPNTWREILTALEAAHIPFPGWRVAVQEYGIRNEEFLDALRERGSQVLPVPVYRWGLPEDLAPLRTAIVVLAAGEADLVLFTTATQVEHVLQVARQDGNEERLREGLRRAVICSIGPTCSEVLAQNGIATDVMPEHPRMGHLVRAAAQFASNPAD